MHDDRSIIRSGGGDDDAAERELGQYQDAWRKMGQLGNLPLSTLLDFAVKYKKKEPAPDFGHTPKARKGRPAGAKNKPKPELVASDG